MTNCCGEPLIIELSAPAGVFDITLSITANSDTTFTVYEKSFGLVKDGVSLVSGERTDIIFSVRTEKDIKIIIDADGDLTATAMAQYAG